MTSTYLDHDVAMAPSAQYRFAIDRGGTFTDLFAECPDGSVKVLKLLSDDPKNYQDAPAEGIRRIMGIGSDEKIDPDRIDWIRMGTTVATNALLERKGEKTALMITKGFKDLLFIGDQTRPRLFDLEVVKPEMLYDKVVEVDERIWLKRTDDDLLVKDDGGACPEVAGSGADVFHLRVAPDPEKVLAALRQLKSEGFRSLAVVLMHSYSWAGHEEMVGKMAEEEGFTNVSLSSKVMPMIRMVPRGQTAVLDAYLTPCLRRYLDGFASGFAENSTSGGGLQAKVTFMQSDGGLTQMETFHGSKAILSGPAGGVVGYARTTPSGRPVIGFDMGGTSTDVSRYDGERGFEHVLETVTAGVAVQAPQLDISTVAAGGGSRLFFRSGMLVVGPESAGAHPGPVCYRKGGPLTVTDANLVLGRLLPEHFPKIFGPGENEALDKAGAWRAFQALADDVNRANIGQPAMTVHELAMGFIRVANEAMCRPIRNITQGKGHDTRNHTLACFGGAGGQHACAVAHSLGIDTVFVHKYAGILSAFGMALADVVEEEQKPCGMVLDTDNAASWQFCVDAMTQMSKRTRASLSRQGFADSAIHVEYYLNLRYHGTDCALMCSAPIEGSGEFGTVDAYLTEFRRRYQAEFGFLLQGRDVVVEDIRVRALGRTNFKEKPALPAEADEKGPHSPTPVSSTPVFFDSEELDTKVFLMDQLVPGHEMIGPCIVMDKLSTILVEPGWACKVTPTGDLVIRHHTTTTGPAKALLSYGTELDTVQLSIFSHRFMSIAEQMGRVLQRTSVSTNIKERLDFSCALFGPDGGLVSNAPHIPVHLGAMQTAVRYQMKALAGNLNRGDVILTNHPNAGGSHLPDMTVITPVFYPEMEEPVFFVANRGHHADIGGISPGSMPPHSKRLWEEGAAFKSFKIVEAGVFQEERLKWGLVEEPAQHPGSSGTRCLGDNLSDLRAQIAANQRGIALVSDLIETYSLEVVQAYMNYIQSNAESAVRQMLGTFGKSLELGTDGNGCAEAEDFMDDGSRIRLKVKIDPQAGSATFDFTGSSPEVWGNTNAPKAVTASALMYSLRCLVGVEIPLNQGCLNPVELVIPEGSLLDPSDEAAVVGGNVLTSQRTVDVILKAFKACAASQGCCNNVTFGDSSFGYYETVAGGSGAGPGWHGRSGVHVHMTNTRLTDPEVVERRYPVLVSHFSLADGSGGRGRFKGGDGVDRRLTFRKSLDLSVLTERRVFAPYGMNGGSDGSRGSNLLVKKGGKTLYLGSKCAIRVEPGDTFVMKTPGGGGWGAP